MTWAQVSLGREFRCLSECSLPSKLVNSVTFFLLVPLNNLYKKTRLSWLLSVEKDSFLFQYLHWDSSDDPSAQWGQTWWLQDLGEQGAHPGGELEKTYLGQGSGQEGPGLSSFPQDWLSHATTGRASPSNRIPGVKFHVGRDEMGVHLVLCAGRGEVTFLWEVKWVETPPGKMVKWES